MNTLQYESRMELANPACVVARRLLWAMVISLAWAVTAAVVALANQGTAWVQHGPASVLLLLGIPFGLTGIALPIGYLAVISDARRVDELRRSFAAGGYLVRWRYAADTWATYRRANADAEESQRREVRGWSIGVGILGVAVFFITPLFHLSDASAAAVIRIMALVVAAVSLLLGLLHHWQWARRRAAMARSLVTIIGARGAYANGKWIVWGTATGQLADVSYQPPTTAGELGRIVFKIYNGNNVAVEEVLVPKGNEDLARRVIQAVRTGEMATAGGGMNRAMNWLRILLLILRSFR